MKVWRTPLCAPLPWPKGAPSLFSVGTGNQIISWNLDPEHWVSLALDRANRRMDDGEWRQFVAQSGLSNLIEPYGTHRTTMTLGREPTLSISKAKRRELSGELKVLPTLLKILQEKLKIYVPPSP